MRDLAGHLVAEAALPPMSEVADETEHIQMTTFAHVPAGGADYVMVLVLARRRSARFDEAHDLAVYPQSQRFLLPKMRGEVGFRIDGDRVCLSVEHIENPRDPGNCSGTLALELWALPAPYQGGDDFQGAPLARAVIGSLNGQNESTVNSFDLPFARPPAGQWHLVLMLREWTALGYRTRDFTNFPTPVSYDSPVASAPPETKAESPTKPQPAQPPAPAKLLTLGSRPESATSPVSPRTPAAAATRPAAAPSAPIPPAVAKVVAKPAALIPVNTASEADLATIDGLSPQLARAIIKKRPFASVEDLRRVKGIAPKLLAALRSRLRI